MSIKIDGITVAGTGVSSFNGRTGAVKPQNGDYTATQVSFVPGETGMTSRTVQEAVQELFTSVSDGKSLIASAITDKGVPTASDAAFQTMKENILAIPSGGLPDDVYTIGVQASAPEGGTVAGGGVASSGMTVTVSATPTENHKFSGWSENSSVVSEDADYTFAVTGDRSLVAGFAEKPASRLPDGYTELEYIESTGSQYIASPPFVLSSTSTILHLKAEIVGAGWLVGYYSNKTTYAYIGLQVIGTSSTGFKLSFWGQNNYGTNQNAMLTVPFTGTDLDVVADFNASKVIVNGEEYNPNKGTYTSSLSVTPYIFAQVYNLSSSSTAKPMNFSKMKLKEMKVYYKDTLRTHFIPCTNASGVAGMYDLVQGKFYKSASTTAFVAGPAI